MQYMAREISVNLVNTFCDFLGIFLKTLSEIVNFFARELGWSLAILSTVIWAMGWSKARNVI